MLGYFVSITETIQQKLRMNKEKDVTQQKLNKSWERLRWTSKIHKAETEQKDKKRFRKSWLKLRNVEKCWALLNKIYYKRTENRLSSEYDQLNWEESIKTKLSWNWAIAMKKLSTAVT